MARRRRQPIGANVAYSYVNYAAGALATLCLVPLFTRFLGGHLYGEFVVIMTLVSNLSVVNIGLDQALSNEVAYATAAGDDAQIGQLISTVVAIYLIAAPAVTVLLAAASPWLCRTFVSRSDEMAPVALAGLGALTMASLPLKAYGTLLRGLGAVFEEQKIGAIFAIARILVTAIIVIGGFKLLGVAVAQGLLVFGAGLSLYFRSRALTLHRVRLSLVSSHVFRSLAVSGLAFALLRLAGIVGFGIDNLVVGYALGPEQVTRYSVAFSLVVMCGATVFSTLSSAMLPTVSAIYARDNKNLLRQYLSLIGRLAVLYAGASAICLWIAGPWFLQLWAGHQVFPGALTFALLITLLVMQVLIEPFWMILVASTNHYGAAGMHTLESALNLGLSVWWVRDFGLAGVIAGTVAARLITTGWYIPAIASRILGAKLKRGIHRIIAPALLSVAASGSFLWFVRIPPGTIAVPIDAAAAALIFSVGFSVLAFTPKERVIAIQFIRELRGRSLKRLDKTVSPA